MQHHPSRSGLTLAALTLGWTLPAFGASPAPTISGYAATNPRGVRIFSAPPGAPLLILGANLGTSGAIAFNGIPAPPALSWSPTEILAIVPTAPSYPFKGPVTVTANGQTAGGPQFTITPPPPPPPPLPRISGYAAPSARGISILSAPPIANLLILGQNLGTSGTVVFNGVAALPAISWSPTEILVTVPAAPAYPFKGPVTITTMGQSAKGPEFTITPPPILRDYTIQRVIKLGDTAAGVNVLADGYLFVGGLNDKGQLLFVAANVAGGEALLQYANRLFTPIVVAGRSAPGGQWPNDIYLGRVSMNQRGKVVFHPVGDSVDGLFLWDDQAQKVADVAQPGTAAGTAGTFVDFGVPRINNHDEIAFQADVQNAAGDVQPALFFRGQDGTLLPVVAPGQKLPATVNTDSFLPGGFRSISLNDAGLVAFVASDPDTGEWVGYLWEKGPISNLATDLGDLGDRSEVWLNNKNRSVLVAAGGSLFRVMDGKSSPVAESVGVRSGSDPNEAGQHAFVADGGDATGVYLLDVDGTPSLILKSGTMTDLGLITTVVGWEGVGLNSHGQIAVTVQIDDGPDTLVLLTPIKP